MCLIIGLIVVILFIVYVVKSLAEYPKWQRDADSLSPEEAERRVLAEDDEKQYSMRDYRTK